MSQFLMHYQPQLVIPLKSIKSLVYILVGQCKSGRYSSLKNTILEVKLAGLFERFYSTVFVVPQD